MGKGCPTHLRLHTVRTQLRVVRPLGGGGGGGGVLVVSPAAAPAADSSTAQADHPASVLFLKGQGRGWGHIFSYLG